MQHEPYKIGQRFEKAGNVFTISGIDPYEEFQRIRMTGQMQGTPGSYEQAPKLYFPTTGQFVGQGGRLGGTDLLSAMGFSESSGMLGDAREKLRQFLTLGREGEMTAAQRDVYPDIKARLSPEELARLGGQGAGISSTQLQPQLQQMTGVAQAPDPLANIRKVFGPEWQPAPAFQDLQKQGIFGAVRVGEDPRVFTLGPGGRLETPESFQQKFGTLEQQGIVGQVTPEQARLLGIDFVPKKNGRSIDEFVEEIDGTIGDAAEGGVVGTSDAARALGIGEPPQAPDSFTGEDQTQLTTAQKERTDIQEEMTSILDERLKVAEEFQKFQDEQVGLPEAGRVGSVAEKGKELQRRLDVLNRRELVLETKLQNRNTVISELMSAKRQDYEDAVQTYNTRFTQAIQLYNLFDKKGTELQKNAQASLDVLIEAFSGQIQNGQVTFEDVMAAHGNKIRELELQIGLPEGSTRELLKSESVSQKGFEYKGTIGSAETGYKALWINTKTGESKLDFLAGGTGGGISSEGKTLTEDDIVSNLTAQRLDPGIMTEGGDLQKSQRDNITASGVPPSVVDFIWKSLKAGKSLDQIRTDLTELQREAGSSDPREAAFVSLDVFMQTLQEDKTKVDNPFK